MKSTIVITLVGIFALAIKNRIIEVRLFSEDPQEAAYKITELQQGKTIDDLIQLLETLRKKGYDEFLFEEQELAVNVEKKLNLKSHVIEEPKTILDFKEELEDVSIKLRFKDPKTFRDYVHKVTLAIAEKAVTKETQRRDLHAIQVIRTLDDLDRTLNLFSGRIREWYGLHFPELDKLLEKHETYLRLVSNLAVRENFTVERLELEGIPSDKAKVIHEKSKVSMGFAANPDDLALLKILSSNTLELYKCRNMAEEFLASIMKEVAPNMTAVLGPLLSARLIAIAGSLDRLAKMPSSTIQVLGAEKALFRSLKTGSRPPKHGIIFQYQALHTAPRWQRGKISRTLASKLSIASRVDAFRGEFIGDKLGEYIERRIKEIQEKYPSPPPVRKKIERNRG